MPACGSHSRRYSYHVDGLTPPDLIKVDGVRATISQQVIQEELVRYSIAGLQKNDKHWHHELLGDPRVIELSRTRRNFSSSNGSRMKSTVFATFHRQPDPRIPSPPSWTVSKVWDQTQAVADEALQVATKTVRLPG